MKKTLILLLTLIVILSSSFLFFGCDSDNDNFDEEESATTKELASQNATAECEHIWLDATCLDSQICSVCGKEGSKPLGHTTEKGTCSRCGEKFGWYYGEFVDEFQQPTGQRYVYTFGSGTYSNNYVKNGNLDYILSVSFDSVVGYIMSIDLFEEGQASYYTDATYTLIIRDSKGEKHKISSYSPLSDNGFLLASSYVSVEKILKLIKDNETLQFYFEENDYGNRTFLFTVTSGNFEALWNAK